MKYGSNIRYNRCETLLSKKFRGFTALELMVVLALIAIFTALALPSFTGTLKRYRVDMASSKIVNALQFARSEAIRTRQAVTVTSPDDCTDWSCGIKVLDINDNTLKIISKSDLNAVKVQLTASDNATAIAYTPLGYIQDSVGGTINVWPLSDGDFAAASYSNIVCLGAGGSIRVLTPPNTAENCPN